MDKRQIRIRLMPRNKSSRVLLCGWGWSGWHTVDGGETQISFVFRELSKKTNQVYVENRNTKHTQQCVTSRIRRRVIGRGGPSPPSWPHKARPPHQRRSLGHRRQPYLYSVRQVSSPPPTNYSTLNS